MFFLEAEGATACVYYCRRTDTWSADAVTDVGDGTQVNLYADGLPSEGAAKERALLLLARVRAERERLRPKTRFEIIEGM